jgi:hypothetical protein
VVLAVNSVNWLVFVAQTLCVSCEVRTEFVCINQKESLKSEITIFVLECSLSCKIIPSDEPRRTSVNVAVYLSSVWAATAIPPQCGVPRGAVRNGV